jgi:hypothetical protein
MLKQGLSIDTTFSHFSFRWTVPLMKEETWGLKLSKFESKSKNILQDLKQGSGGELFDIKKNREIKTILEN